MKKITNVCKTHPQQCHNWYGNDEIAEGGWHGTEFTCVVCDVTIDRKKYLELMDKLYPTPVGDKFGFKGF